MSEYFNDRVKWWLGNMMFDVVANQIDRSCCQGRAPRSNGLRNLQLSTLTPNVNKFHLFILQRLHLLRIRPSACYLSS